jgi:hypothetical protein
MKVIKSSDVGVDALLHTSMDDSLQNSGEFKAFFETFGIGKN